MDIEQLNKSQIVLLTLLVSFVTSIATGIVTVSLMEQAPPAIAQTVNRVIERTVETVTPSNNQGQPAAATVVTQEKTIIVKETDLISQAIDRVSPAVVRIQTTNETNPAFVALGVIIDTKGAIVTDSSAVAGSDYVAVLSDGAKVRMFVNARDEKSGFAFLQPAKTAEALPQWKPAAVATNRVVLGTTIVGIAGKTVSRILPGIVTEMPEEHVIDTSISADSIQPGSAIINTDGNVVGVSTGASRTSSNTAFMSAILLVPPTE